MTLGTALIPQGDSVVLARRALFEWKHLSLKLKGKERDDRRPMTGDGIQEMDNNDEVKGER